MLKGTGARFVNSLFLKEKKNTPEIPSIFPRNRFHARKTLENDLGKKKIIPPPCFSFRFLFHPRGGFDGKNSSPEKMPDDVGSK